MAHLAMLNASMSSLSLTRSCTRPGFGVSNGTLSHTCMRKKDTFHVEVTVEETEPADSAMRRFRRAVMASNLIMEARRRRNFENTQDIKKRKIRERGQRKKRQFRVTTYDEQSGLDPAPFADLFGESDDLFDGDLGPDLQPQANGRQRARTSYQGGQSQAQPNGSKP